MREAKWPASTPDPDLSGSRTISNSKSLHRCGPLGTPPGCGGRENIDFTYCLTFDLNETKVATVPKKIDVYSTGLFFLNIFR